jgi:hypothetical protein
VRLLTKTADKLIELVVPHATASASTILLYCGCIDGYKTYQVCVYNSDGYLKCGSCTTRKGKC